MGIIVFVYPLGVWRSLFFFSVLKLDFELQPLFNVSITKVIFTQWIRLKHKSIHGRLTKPCGVKKFMANKMNQFSISYTLALVGCCSTSRFYSQWPAYKLVYLFNWLIDYWFNLMVSISYISSAVSPWRLNLKSCNLASWFICLCRL